MRGRDAAVRPAHLLGSWESLEPRLAKASLVCLFLDFDGTLAPFAPKPSLASLPEGTRRVLEGLSRCRRVRTVVISGRSLADIKQIVGISDILYVGNHGLEVHGPGFGFTHPDARGAAPEVKRVSRVLTSRLRGIGGVIVEDKGLTASVHYRLSAARDEPAILSCVSGVMNGNRKLMLRRGKEVLEIRPNLAWGKGQASLMILEAQGRDCLPIYIGDDQTDEEAFRAIRRGITILVSKGGGATAAKHYLNDPEEVRAFLERLYDIRCG